MKTRGVTQKLAAQLSHRSMKKKEIAKITTDPLAKRISKHPFLRGLTNNQLTLLADCALPAQFKAGQIIFREGEKAKLFYLLDSVDPLIPRFSPRARTKNSTTVR